MKISRPIVERNFPISVRIFAVTPKLDAPITLAMANDFTKPISIAKNPKTPAAINGIRKPMAEPANILPRRTLNNAGRSISSRPIKKNKKNTPIEIKISISSIGSTIKNIAGPTTIPATTFPIIVG